MATNPFAGMASDNPSESQEEPMPGNMRTTQTDYSNYQVKYAKINMDDQGEVSFLEALESRAIQGDGTVVVLTKEKFSFQTEYFIVISYLQRKGETLFKEDKTPERQDDEVTPYKV